MTQHCPALATCPALNGSPPRQPNKHKQASTMAPIPKTMSGILIEETGGVEVLKWKTDLPVPDVKEGEILVRNEFVGVNYIDTYASPLVLTLPLICFPGFTLPYLKLPYELTYLTLHHNL